MDNRKYLAYYRISKDNHEAGKSKSKGLGLDAQQQIVNHFFGANIAIALTETKSAKNITDRPILKEAIELCLKHGYWLCTAKLDRLSRSVDDIRYIHKILKGKIAFCDLPSSGEPDLFTITLFSAFAERERQLISLRTSQALQAKLRRGESWGSPKPHIRNGSMNQLSREAKNRIALSNPNSIRASIIIHQLRSAGKSLRTISQILNSNQFKTPLGCQFNQTSVKRILKRFPQQPSTQESSPFL